MTRRTGSMEKGRQAVKLAHVATVDMSLRYLLLHQLEAARNAGFEVTGVSAGGPHVDALGQAGIRHIEVPMTRAFAPVRDLVAIAKLVRVFRRERFTIVHTHTPKGGLLGQYAALLAGVPIRVHTIHGLYFPAHVSPRLRWVFAMLERVTMAFSAHNFCQNPEDVRTALDSGICTKERIEFIGNGIDISEFDPDSQPREKRLAKRSSLGFERHHLIVGAVGRLVREKGYIELLRAAQIVRVSFPDARFLIVGGMEPDKPDAISPEVAEQMGIADIVKFVGHRDDMPDLYAIMDIFALPSYREGFPRAPMEAAAMGIPIVVTDVRGCRETVTHDESGLLVPVRNHEALARAINALLRDEAKRLRLGAAARRKAVAEFDERHVFTQILSGYRRLLMQRKVAGRKPQQPRSAAS